MLHKGEGFIHCIHLCPTRSNTTKYYQHHKNLTNKTLGSIRVSFQQLKHDLWHLNSQQRSACFGSFKSREALCLPIALNWRQIYLNRFLIRKRWPQSPIVWNTSFVAHSHLHRKYQHVLMLLCTCGLKFSFKCLVSYQLDWIEKKLCTFCAPNPYLRSYWKGCGQTALIVQIVVIRRRGAKSTNCCFRSMRCSSSSRWAVGEPELRSKSTRLL